MKIGFMLPLMVVLFPWMARTQQAMLRSEIPSGFKLVHIPFAETPKSDQYTGFSFAFNTGTGAMALYGELPGEKIIYIEPFSYAHKFYPATYTGVSCNGQEIKICSTVPGKATEICGVFKFEEETMYYQSFTEEDLSKAQTERGLKLLEDKKPLDALAVLDSVQYSDAYFVAEETGVKLLKSVHEYAAALVTKRKFADAANAYGKVLGFKGLKFIEDNADEAALKTKIGKGLHSLTFDQLGEILGTYVLALVDAKSYDAATPLIHKYKKRYPALPELFLAEGNLFYGQKDKETAKKSYQEYISLMKAQKRTKDIDPVIEQRAQ